MKIPNNTILTIGGFIGSFITIASCYWIGRRNELNQIIDLGREVEYESNFRSLNMYDNKHKPVILHVRTEENSK